MPGLQLISFLILFRKCAVVESFLFPSISGRCPRSSSGSNLCSSVENKEALDDDSTFACSIPQKLSREDGQRVMDEIILPSLEYDDRMRYGRDAQDVASSTIVAASDPRMAYTYGEFPMSSLDELVDLALTHSSCSGKKEVTMIDLGSGCGRLVLYSAMTRGNEDDTSWTIHGIEISDVLHDEGLRASLAGLDNGWFQLDKPADTADGNQFVLRRGPAEDFASLFRQADIVFAYSTVFDTAGFSEELGAIIMSRKWNELLSKSCSPGTIVITTDRCLDPNYGWKLVDRLDVDNREVMGSTGYIQIYRP